MPNVQPEQIEWDKPPFQLVTAAVAAEAQRSVVCTKFLPPYGPVPSDQTIVPADKIIIDPEKKTMSVDQGVTASIIEIMVQFTLTQQQYDESQLNTAVTLATRAANLLAQAQDLVFFRGKEAEKAEFFADNPVVFGSNGPGLPRDLVGLLRPTPTNKIQVLPKESLNGSPGKYGEHTSSAVGQAYSLLQSKGHYGPYALVLHSDIYADTIESLENTLIMPADRIKFFVTETGPAMAKDEVRFYGTGTLLPFTGLFMSLGGDTMDAVVANGPSTRHSHKEKGQHLFEVFERFTLRLKDPTAVVLLEFAEPKK